MRLGLVIYGSLDTVSGGYLYDRQLVDYLQAHGHSVDIISQRWRDYPRHLLDNFRPLTLPDVDILLQDELNHPSLFWHNQHINIPIVSIVHHLRISENHSPYLLPFYRHVEQYYLNSVDAFIFNSDTTHQTVETYLHHTKPYTIAKPSGSRFTGIPAAAIIKRTALSRPLHILFVGNLIPRKGLDMLLKAIVNLPVHLTVIGSTTVDPTYTQHIQTLITDHDLNESVDLVGQVSDTELETHFTQADVLAVPSTYEGFGIVYLEGMAFGLPAIGTTSGAAHEIITSGQDGFLIPAGDVASLTHHIKQLCDDRMLLQQMSLSARKRFQTHPTWTQTFQGVEQFLLELTE